MRPLGAALDDAAARAEAKRKRHRVWHWCRRKNGFCDDPLWGVVAERLSLPPYQIVAFVNRLEEHANAATPRGYVGEFKAAVFGRALGMTADDAARIFAELEHPDVGWIDQDHVVTFYERNKDDESQDATAALRSRRAYARRELRRALGRLSEQGLIARADAEAVQVDLDHMGDEELFELERRRKIGQLAGFALSTPHAFSRRENVRPHTRADATESDHTAAVDNFSDGARGESAGSPKGDAAGAGGSQQLEAWLREQGLRIIIERMNLPRGLAETRLERWVRELQGDAAALAPMIEAAEAAMLSSADFLVKVKEQIDRRLRDAEGPRLPLMRKLGGAA